MPPRLPSRAFDALLTMLVLLTAILIAGPVRLIPLHVPLSYNEGWNAAFDLRAVTPGAGSLYPAPDSLLFNNYPPLGFLLVGAAGRWLSGGDMILAGRVIALAALLGCGALLTVALRRMSVGTRPAIAAGVMMVLTIATFFRVYVAMDDPQWLAHAAMLAGLVVLLGGAASPGAGRVGVAAALMVVGGLIKHNLVALPLATTLWLLWLRPRTGLVWLAAAAICAAAGLLWLRIGYGDAAFTSILGHHRIFALARMRQAGHKLLPLLPAWLLSLGVGLAARHEATASGRAQAVLSALFVVIATVTGVVERTGEGVYYNAHFETVIATWLAFGLAAGSLARRKARIGHWLVGPATLLVACALPVLVSLPPHLRIARTTWTGAQPLARAWAPVIGRLAEADGPVACLMPSLCYWAGKPVLLDLFNLTQDALDEGRNPGNALAGFRRAVAAHRFVLFQDDPASSIHEDARQHAGTDPVMAVLERDYAVISTGPDGTTLLAPRG